MNPIEDICFSWQYQRISNLQQKTKICKISEVQIVVCYTKASYCEPYTSYFRLSWLIRLHFKIQLLRKPLQTILSQWYAIAWKYPSLVNLWIDTNLSIHGSISSGCLQLHFINVKSLILVSAMHFDNRWFSFSSILSGAAEM